MKRTVLIILSIFLFLVSIPMLIGGVLLVSLSADDDPTIQGRIGEVRSPGYAVVSDIVEIDWDYPFADRYDLTIGVSNVGSSTPVFIGFGPSASVDSYLAGAPYTLVHSIGDGSRHDRDVEVPGSAVPPPPGEMTFWVQESSGSGLQTIPLAAQNGDFRFVAMNADGTPGVAVAVYGSITLPFLFPLGVGLLLTGCLLALLGILALIFGIRASPKPKFAAQPGIPYSAGTGQASATQQGGRPPAYPSHPYPPPAYPPPAPTSAAPPQAEDPPQSAPQP